ncbi:MAG TPA: DUF5602 domain-containing protein [Longimicrobiaceae bacterium]|nr:DUF5602 domain-containing protein [Longimicrobiaceae bacterium]
MPAARRYAPLVACILAALTAACAPDAPTIANPDPASAPAPNRAGYEQPGVHRQYGTPQKIGDGMARTYVVLDVKSAQAPLELGIALSEKALTGLPSAEGEYSFILPLPQHAPTPYRFAELDWNPHGHPPVGIYSLPHFDFHFYTISLQERNAILPSDPNFAAEANNVPTGAFVPPFYVPLVPPGGQPADAAVPQMGVHWFDVRAPEFHGETFTSTFIYGSWNGRFTFYEPMVTREFLQSKPEFAAPIPFPQSYPAPGYYPTSYRVTYDAQAKEYRVALAGLTAWP